MKTIHSLWAALLCVGISGAGAVVAAVPLAVELQPVAGTANDAVVRWSITNQSRTDVQVLSWETPLQGVSRSLFEVSLNGQAVAYAEKQVHWGHPEAKDFITLAPGQTLSADINLAQYYRMTEAGSYAVGFAGELKYVLAESAQKAGHIEDLGDMTVSADAIQITSQGRPATFYDQLIDRSSPVMSAGKALGYANCSSTRQSQINTAHNSAKTYASNSLAYLNAGTSGSRYTTWFGSYTSNRYSTVKSHYSKINNVLQNLNTTYDCACDPAYASAYAYVYPGSPYRIYLCNAFWAAPNTGTDSRAGTIIHEQSHFTVNGGTQDHVYGQTAAKNLARTNPNRAVANADNHEYFSENTPALN